jgi:hypothetical protein
VLIKTRGTRRETTITMRALIRPAKERPPGRDDEQETVEQLAALLDKVELIGPDSWGTQLARASISARHFAVMGENREDVWLDNQGIPVMFRTVEDGTPIDFVLQDPAAAAVAETLATKGATATIQTEGSDIDRGKR